MRRAARRSRAYDRSAVDAPATGHLADPAARGRPPWFLFPPSPFAASLVGFVGSVGPELKHDLGIGYAGLAALFVGQTLGTMTGAGAVGVSGARWLRPVPMALLAGAALALAAGAAHRLEVLIVLMALGAFGAYALNARAQGDISAIAGPRRATLLGLFHVFGGSGAALFPLVIAGLLALGVSWRVSALLLGALFVAYAWPCRRWPEGAPPTGLRLDAVRRIARGNAGAALVVAVLGVGMQIAVPLWIPTILHDRFHASSAASTTSAGVYMGALLVTRAGSALWVGRIGGRPILVAGAVAVFAGHVVLWLANGVPMMLAATVLIGAGAGPLLPVGIARVAQWSQADRLGTAAVMSLAGVAQIILPACVIAAHAAGLPLQHAAAVTIVTAGIVLAAAPRA